MDKEEFFLQYDSLNPKHQKAFAIAIFFLVFAEDIKDDDKILQLFNETLGCDKQIFDTAAKVIHEMSPYVSFTRAVWNLGEKCGAEYLEK